MRRDRLHRGIARGIAAAAIASGFVAVFVTAPSWAVAADEKANEKADKKAKESAEEKPAPAPKVNVGDMAPDFTLKDNHMNDVTLSEFRGKKSVVLAFYVFAFTGG